MSPEDRNAVIEECAKVARHADRVGREWVKDSLWDKITELSASAVLKLKTIDNRPAEVIIREDRDAWPH